MKLRIRKLSEMKESKKEKLLDDFMDYVEEIDSTWANEIRLWIPDYLKMAKDKKLKKIK